MNISKTLQWIGAFVLICTGSVLLFLLRYKNNDIIDAITYGLIFLGWIGVSMIIDSYINALSNSTGKVKPRWFVKRLGATYTYAAALALTLGNILGVQRLGNERRVNILTNGPTQITVAVVSGIEVYRGRSSDHYYAVFEYQAAGHTIRRRRDEENGDFVQGQKVRIRYSVGYPGMFRIIEKLP